MVEGKSAVNQRLVSRLHGVIRPFILRRLKSEVAKQVRAVLGSARLEVSAFACVDVLLITQSVR